MRLSVESIMLQLPHSRYIDVKLKDMPYDHQKTLQGCALNVGKGNTFSAML
ncbi:hypothetical protein SAMN05444162_4578 [Paenibacillaceae bacterium GAS479]|nr:hypothetical protein SAMN05444162_4578 [Paenibacillaceae bacterium GAS479]